MSLTVVASSSADPVRRGESFGREWGPEISTSWQSYQQVFAENEVGDALPRRVADQAYEVTRAWAPALADEIAAVARGAGLETWQGAALNARSEILAAAGVVTPGECSTAVYLPEVGAPRTVQTWDWHHALSGSTLIWQYPSAPGRTVKTFTEFGLLGKIGVNTAGLGLHFNLLQHHDDGGRTGVPVHLVARRVLDEASTVAEAEALIRSATVSASVALTVVAVREDRGEAATFEVSPAGVARVDPDPQRLVRHTNHFVDAELAGGERLGPDDPDTYARLDELGRRTEELARPAFADRVQALNHHRADGAALCCHPDAESPWQTHVVVGIEAALGRLLIEDGSPCAARADSWLRI